MSSPDELPSRVVIPQIAFGDGGDFAKQRQTGVARQRLAFQRTRQFVELLRERIGRVIPAFAATERLLVEQFRDRLPERLELFRVGSRLLDRQRRQCDRPRSQQRPAGCSAQRAALSPTAVLQVVMAGEALELSQLRPIRFRDRCLELFVGQRGRELHVLAE